MFRGCDWYRGAGKAYRKIAYSLTLQYYRELCYIGKTLLHSSKPFKLVHTSFY